MMLLEDSWRKVENLQLPDKAKLDRAKPAVKIPTISHGGNPISTDESVMQIAGDTNAIVWQIFRTYMVNFQEVYITEWQQVDLDNWETIGENWQNGINWILG